MMPGLEILSYKERQDRLGLFSLECRRMRSHLIEVYKIMRGIDKKVLWGFCTMKRYQQPMRLLRTPYHVHSIYTEIIRSLRRDYGKQFGSSFTVINDFCREKYFPVTQEINKGMN
eukprot:g30101.t1